MNILIVEGASDKYFFDYMLKNVMNEDKVQVESVNKVEIIDVEGLGNLSTKINSKINAMGSKSNNRMGIVVDLDYEKSGGGYQERLKNINEAVQKAFADYFKSKGESVVAIQEFTNDERSINIRISDKSTVEIKYHFIHLNGKGELEDILKKIKLHDSHHADCVDDGWRCCLKRKGLDKTEKEINKTWLDYYIRHDILSAEERKNAKTTCNLGYVLNDDNRKGMIFDFNDACLNNIKDFLKLFKSETVV